jgi:hypothetical protein
MVVKKAFFTLLVVCNIILYLTSLALWISIDDEIVLNSIVSSITILLTLVIVFIKRDKFAHYYKSSQFKNLSSALINCFLVFCILGLINYLFFKNPFQIDLSQKKFNSLRTQTVKVLDDLKGEVKVEVFAKKMDHSRISELFKLYKVHKTDISVKYIDIDTRPDLVSEANITQAPTIIVKKGDRVARFTRTRELEFTNALYKVGRDKETIICVDSSHSKFSWFSDDQNHHSALRKLLGKEGFRVEDYKLVSSEPLNPCDALVLWGVDIDLGPKEIDSVAQFMDKGRSVLIAINPQFNGDSIPNFRKYLKSIGIRVHNLLAISPNSHVRGSQGSVPIATKFDLKHPILEGFNGHAFFPLATALEFDKMKISKGKKLITSSTVSWAESDFLNLEKKYFDKKVDLPGPLHFALANEFENKSRMVVFSNSSFVSNNFTKYAGHFAIMVNTISWLTRNDQLITFDRTTMKDEPIFISAPQLGIIFFFSVVIVPVLLIITAIVIYRRRGKL